MFKSCDLKKSGIRPYLAYLPVFPAKSVFGQPRRNILSSQQFEHKVSFEFFKLVRHEARQGPVGRIFIQIQFTENSVNPFSLQGKYSTKKNRAEKAGYTKIHNILSQFTGSDTSCSYK